jgi:histidyl-tRNA synthetase
LRKRGYNVELYHTVKKWDKHFKYAEKKQIPFIWYVKDNGVHEVKNMISGKTVTASAESWNKTE